MGYLKIKRILDMFVSLLVFIILSPVLILITLIVKSTSKGPAIFKQKRVGINKSHFYIYKFRTMRMDTPDDIPTHLLENPEKWITKFGVLLRKSSLDELPQLLNIIMGHMSFVGPRPALWNQYNLIEERDKYGANDVPVGLTGWAQVNGRDDLPIEVKARFDGDYAKNISFGMDMKCLLKTLKIITDTKSIK